MILAYSTLIALYVYNDLIINSFIYSYRPLIYIAPARELLIGAPNASTAKRVVLRWKRKNIWYGSIKKTKFRRETVQDRGAHHGEGVVLPSEGTDNREKEKTMLGWAMDFYIVVKTSLDERSDRQLIALFTHILGRYMYIV